MVFSCVIDELLQPEDRESKTTIISAQYRDISVLPYPPWPFRYVVACQIIFSVSASHPSASTGNIPSLTLIQFHPFNARLLLKNLTTPSANCKNNFKIW
jgi:hypothetical protein